MAALTGARNTREMEYGGEFMTIPVEAATTIFVGSMVMINSNGRAVPAAPAATGAAIVVGRMQGVLNGIPGNNAINQAGADCPPNPPNLGAAGAISVNVKRKGAFEWDIAAGGYVQTSIGKLVYAVDDHTVDLSSSTGTRVCAGRIVALGEEPNQVYVENYAQWAVSP